MQQAAAVGEPVPASKYENREQILHRGHTPPIPLPRAPGRQQEAAAMQGQRAEVSGTTRHDSSPLPLRLVSSQGPAARSRSASCRRRAELWAERLRPAP